MVYSEDEFYDRDNCLSITWDDIMEEVEREAWDDFDARDHLDDYYNNMSDLWDDIESDGTDGVVDKMWGNERDRLYDEAREAMRDCDGDGRFDIEGHSYKCMSKWEVVF